MTPAVSPIIVNLKLEVPKSMGWRYWLTVRLARLAERIARTEFKDIVE